MLSATKFTCCVLQTTSLVGLRSALQGIYLRRNSRGSPTGPTKKMSQAKMACQKPYSSAAWMHKSLPRLPLPHAEAQIWNGCCLMSDIVLTMHRSLAEKVCSLRLPAPRVLGQAAARKTTLDKSSCFWQSQGVPQSMTAAGYRLSRARSMWDGEILR